MDFSEYKHGVVGLVFLKSVDDTFGERRTQVAVDLESDGITGEQAAGLWSLGANTPQKGLLGAAGSPKAAQKVVLDAPRVTRRKVAVDLGRAGFLAEMSFGTQISTSRSETRDDPIALLRPEPSLRGESVGAGLGREYHTA